MAGKTTCINLPDCIRPSFRRARWLRSAILISFHVKVMDPGGLLEAKYVRGSTVVAREVFLKIRFHIRLADASMSVGTY